MAETNRDRKAELAAMTAEELEQRLRETFFYPDKIDETVYLELEALREALEEKRPPEAGYTAEESWALFLEDRADELEGILPSALRQAAAKAADEGRAPDPHTAGGAGSTVPPDPERSPRRFAPAPAKKEPGLSRRFSPAVLRRALIAAVITVLLAGAALAADYAGLVAWIRGWSDNPERYAQTGSGSPGPIKEALQDLGIDDPVYPAWLPSNYILTETLISKDPLLLYELYTKADRYVSITITPISAANTAIYPQGKWLQEKNQPGKPAHYIFSNDESITVVWYTENYFTSISSNITAGAMERIIESVYTGQTKGEN